MLDSTIQQTCARLGIDPAVDTAAHASVLALFDDCVARFGDAPAYTSLGRTISYRELDQLSRQFAAWLQQCSGLQQGDRVAIQLPNLVQYPVALFGAMRAGMIVVNTNPLYTPRELHHQLVDSGAKVLVVLANVAHVAQEALQGTQVEKVVVVEVADLHAPLKRWLINNAAKYLKKLVPPFHIPGAIRFTAVMAQGRHCGLVPATPTGQDVAVLQYTGGTTGVSKGAMLSHANLVANALQCREMFRTVDYHAQGEILIQPLPLYHIYAFIVSLTVMATGNHVVLIPNPRDLPGFVKELRKWRFTGFVGLNTLFVALCHNAEFRTLDFSGLKMTLSGGMALTRSAWEAWKQLTGSSICEGYGLTEASPVICVNPGNGNQQGTVGLPVPGTRVKLVDEQGGEVADGEPGELCAQGPQVMLGYWQRPEETRKVLSEDGWLRTGDVAVYTPEGYLRIVDRIKDMISVSGFKVFPNEIEDVLCQHPGVLECAVIGIPDEHSGEAVKAFVVRKDPTLTDKALLNYARESLTGYKLPRHIEFRDSLPKSNVGKVLRKELRPAA